MYKLDSKYQGTFTNKSQTKKKKGGVWMKYSLKTYERIELV